MSSRYAFRRGSAKMQLSRSYGRAGPGLGLSRRRRPGPVQGRPRAATADGLMNDVTRILAAVEQGATGPAEQLLPLVYDELRKLAAARLVNESPGQTLDATALVHEAYMRLVGPTNDRAFANRKHFFVAASEAMRRILVENARRKHRAKRGGKLRRVDLEGDALEAPQRDERVLALDEALERFAALEPAKAELLKLHSFGGLSLAEAAEVMGVSPTTADRWWAYARAWLRADISAEKEP
jgi:RNA polymerase sigma factor (TIGR02999 family)